MKVVCFLNSFTFKEGNDSIPAKVPRKIARALQRRYVRNLPNEQLRCNKVKKRGDCIASLTSFPARIDTAYISIKSLLNQTVPPKEIILWLSEEEFPDHKLPENLKELLPYGLKIEYCDNLLGHKKYFYALQKYSNETLISYDDDLIYPEDSIERLLKTSKKYPGCIISNRGRGIVLKDGKVLGYDEWNLNDKELIGKPSYLMMGSNGFGYLMPPNSFPSETFNKERMKELSLYNDELWLKAMSILGHVKVVCTKGPKKPLIPAVRMPGPALAKENVEGHRNDIIFPQTLEAYPEILQILQEEAKQRGRD